jgi:hypothetical protein
MFNKMGTGMVCFSILIVFFLLLLFKINIFNFLHRFTIIMLKIIFKN